MTSRRDRITGVHDAAVPAAMCDAADAIIAAADAVEGLHRRVDAYSARRADESAEQPAQDVRSDDWSPEAREAAAKARGGGGQRPEPAEKSNPTGKTGGETKSGRQKSALSAKVSEHQNAAAAAREAGDKKGEAAHNKASTAYSAAYNEVNKRKDALADAVEGLNRRVDAYCARAADAAVQPARDVRADANSPTYDAALAKFKLASASFRAAQQEYRARKMSDGEFLAAKRAYDKAQEEMDRATPAGH